MALDAALREIDRILKDRPNARAKARQHVRRGRWRMTRTGEIVDDDTSTKLSRLIEWAIRTTMEDAGDE